jgi:hypothetical protein
MVSELEEIDVEAALKVAEYMFRHMREIWDRLGTLLHGAPTGSRTPLPRMKTWCPNR